jgi:hypothetical protein
MTMITQVPESYSHYAKHAVPRGTLAAAGATLKYYHLERSGEPVAEAVDELARAALAGDPRFGFSGDHGFCILHRCGADFYFLLPTVWRGANEAWEAVWYRDGGMADFAPFHPAYAAAAGAARPTFCVWELGLVAHEAAAWSRFLSSPRGEPDLQRWLDDRFEGEV